MKKNFNVIIYFVIVLLIIHNLTLRNTIKRIQLENNNFIELSKKDQYVKVSFKDLNTNNLLTNLEIEEVHLLKLSDSDKLYIPLDLFLNYFSVDDKEITLENLLLNFSSSEKYFIECKTKINGPFLFDNINTTKRVDYL